MAVEEGDRYRSVSNFGTIWIVRRFITGPRMVPHAVLTQIGDASSIRTVSFRALEDRHLFERLSADAVKS
jgi:hypothetical protein